MTRSDMEGTNARRTAHEIGRILDAAFNSFWDATGEQAQTTSLLTHFVVENPRLMEPLMEMLKHAAKAQDNMTEAQRQLRRLKEAAHEWEQGDSGALMDLLGIERANEPQRSKKKTPGKSASEIDITETVETPAFKG